MTSHRAWWNSWGFVAFLALLSALPFIAYPFPPLVDVVGHMGRYSIQLDYATSDDLQRYFTYEFRLMGNIGVDALVEVFGRSVGFEPIVKAVAVLTPPLFIVGLAWLSKVLSGTIKPVLPFAAILAFNFAFLFGFLNFALAAALAFNAFALWVTLGKSGRIALRALMFIPIAVIVYFCHLYGLGLLGLLVFGYEAFGRDSDRSFAVTRLFRAGLRTAPLWPPLLHMILWRSSMSGGDTEKFFSIDRKLTALASVLRDGSILWDLALLAPLVVLVVQAIRKDDFEFEKAMLWICLPLAGAFLLMPKIVFGSNYADARLAAYLVALVILSIRPLRGEALIAALGTGLFVVRIVVVAWGAQIDHALIEENREIVRGLPEGSRLLQLNGDVCPPWKHSPLQLLGSFHMIENDGFSNGTWDMSGANPLQIVYDVPAAYRGNPVKVGSAWGCGTVERQRLVYLYENIPAGKFDYLMIVEPPRWFRPDEKVRKIRSTADVDLYEILPSAN